MTHKLPPDPARVEEEATTLDRVERFALDAILAAGATTKDQLAILASYATRGLLDSVEVLHIRRAIEAVDD